MIARVIVVAALFAALVAWDRSLASDAEATRQARTEDVGRVLSQEELDSLEIAAIRLEWGDGRPATTYARAGGIWRCLEVFQAPADVRALEGLIGAITQAEGRVQSDDPGQTQRYGIGVRETVRFSLCDRNVLANPSASVLWSADVGFATADGGGSYLRPGGSAEIWAVDRNPRPALESHIPNLPPLLDESVLTQSWLQAARGFDRIFLDRADGTSLDMRTRPREVSDEERRQGVPPYEWVLDPEGEALPLPIGRAMSYVFFLQRASYVAILDPRKAGELGLQQPHDVITLIPPASPDGQAAQPLTLHVLPRMSGGGVPLANPFVDTLYELDAETASLMLPARELLMDTGQENPWDAKLKAQHDH
ncbi:MAG: hypothetical protein AAF682_07490 [Planctomycetota bacterium]